jgi:aspartate 1-decarboxylase
MLINVLKAKLHGCRVTEAEVEYMGSLAVSEDIMQAAGMMPYELVMCANFENGERWTTYLIPTKKPGVIGLNGPAAMKGKVGDRIIAMSFALMDESDAQFHQPRVLIFNRDNSFRAK